MNILVFGRTGQIARELNKLVSATFLSRKECDLLNPTNCAEEVTRSNADIVINLAAYTNVDRAEEEQDLAKVVNGEAPAAIAIACASKGIPFIHISTDYVYGDNGQFPITSTTEANPVNIYGKTKLIGDLGIINSGADYVILRTSWVFSKYGNNFLKTIVELSQSSQTLKVINDQVGGPTPASEIAKACLCIAEKLHSDKSLSGIYHFSGYPNVSCAKFAEKIVSFNDKKIEINLIKSAEFKSKSLRQKNSRLDCSDLKNKFEIDRPNWEANVKSIMEEIKP